jgi:AcrR family transcriptional regulator
MRREILDAARALFLAGGYTNVAARGIARQVGCSPAALYRYFKSKDEIFNALAEEGFSLLREMRRREGATPLERFRQFFWGTFEFARLHPEYFHLIFLDRSAPRLSADSPALKILFDSVADLQHLLDDCVAAGELPAGLDVVAVHQVVSSSLHGTAALLVCNRLPPRAVAEVQASAVLDLAIRGLRAGGLDGVRFARASGSSAGGTSGGTPSTRTDPTAPSGTGV